MLIGWSLQMLTDSNLLKWTDWHWPIQIGSSWLTQIHLRLQKLIDSSSLKRIGWRSLKRIGWRSPMQIGWRSPMQTHSNLLKLIG